MMIIGKLNQVLQQSNDGRLAVIEVRNLEPDAAMDESDVKSLLRFKQRMGKIEVNNDDIYEMHGDYVKNSEWGRVFAVSDIKSVNLDRVKHLSPAVRLVSMMGK
ncbi:hypothetical protein OAP63_08940 [Vibrio sp.]|uniref:Uncharacterized protein n=1 Tax=Vibrio viridaestus TaxID=2487322 RepID=A0A3N9TEH0_9VIBR|nr:hypothetical protein [Vibrio viridaestus]MDC0610849.1 hypothetical protein [Vibrio sp.]RQW62631.1 hypothetical protein EES38_12970 [Vibrio viridaestus]